MNVLLVTIDCLRQDRCGTYGHHRDTTPTLDALASEGIVFENAYATGPVTTESFPGILAGRLSAQTVAGETLYQKCIPKGELTIASHLRDAGYDTVGVISNPRVGTHVDSDRGFDTFRNLRTGEDQNSHDTDSQDSSGSGSFLSKIRVGERLYQLREQMRNHDSVPYRYELPFLAFRSYQYLTGWPSVRGDHVVDRLLSDLTDASAPFFAWTHMMDVHGPLHPHVVNDGGLTDQGILSQFRSHARRVSDVYDAQTEARYDSAVRYVDMQLECIVDWLKDTGQWDETLLIVTADHGDALYDRDIYGHPQHYAYDELLSVPLVVHSPDHDHQRIHRPFSLGWLHELIADACGVDRMAAPLTSALTDHLKGDDSTPESGTPIAADSISHRGHTIVLCEEQTKYIKQTGDLADADETTVATSGTYDLSKDPKERHPERGPNPTFEEQVADVVVEPEDLWSGTSTDGIDAATKDRLKQLGYAE